MLNRGIPKKIRVSVGIAFAVILLVIGVAYGVVVYKVATLPDDKSRSIVMLTAALSRKVDYAERTFALERLAPSLVFSQVKIAEVGDAGTFLTAKNAVCRLSPLPLLWGSVKISEIAFADSRLTITRYPNGTFSVSDLALATAAAPVVVEAISFRNASLIFVDERHHSKEKLVNAEIYLSNIGAGKRGSVTIRAVNARGARKTVFISGILELPADSRPEAKTRADVDVFFGDINLEHLRDIFAADLPQWSEKLRLRGKGDFQAHFIGDTENFYLRGEWRFQNLSVLYPPAFLGETTTDDAGISCIVQKNGAELSFKDVTISAGGIIFHGAVDLRDIYSGNPYVDARVYSREFSLRQATPYIPYRIIPTDVADFMRQHIPAVESITVKAARLKGAISQIAAIEHGENHEVLSVRAEITGATVAYGENLPTFHQVSGLLELRGRDFILQDMEGFYGGTPLKADGRITNYNAPTCGNSYEFSLHARPRAAEVEKLVGGFIIQNGGESLLSLNGSGPLHNYRLSGAWDITSVPCTIYGSIPKPSRVRGFVTAVANVTAGGMALERFSCVLAEARLEGRTVTGAPHRGKLLRIQSNNISLGKVFRSSINAFANVSHGSMRLDLLARSVVGSEGFVPVGGNLTFTDVSVARGVIQLAAMNGGIAFTPGEPPRLEASGLVAGNGSYFSVTGEIKSFANSQMRLRVKVPQVLWRDFVGANAAMNATVFTNASALLDIHNDTIAIGYLTATHRDGEVRMRGCLTLSGDAAGASHLSFTTNFMPISALAAMMDFSPRPITGKVSVAGNVALTHHPTASSRPMVANGSLDISAQGGVIVGFSPIYRIFGALNFLNYLKMRLPDTDGEGMPFERISAKVFFNGTEITLRKVFVKSNSINLTILGKMFPGNRTVDLIVGVHPLQSVDQVISGVPLVGWLLTNDKKMLTLFFRATGPSDNPRVEALPAKSLGGGVWDIITKTFSLPVKIFTNTGEVFLGE